MSTKVTRNYVNTPSVRHNLILQRTSFENRGLGTIAYTTWAYWVIRKWNQMVSLKTKRFLNRFDGKNQFLFHEWKLFYQSIQCPKPYPLSTLGRTSSHENGLFWYRLSKTDRSMMIKSIKAYNSGQNGWEYSTNSRQLVVSFFFQQKCWEKLMKNTLPPISNVVFLKMPCQS